MTDMPLEELIKSDPVRYKLCDNNAVYDYSKGRFIGNIGGAPLTAFNSETSRKATIIREEQKAAAIANGMIQGTKTENIGSALQSVVSTITSRAIDPDDPRGIEAGRLLFQVADIMPDKQQAPRSVQVNVLSPEIARLILQQTGDVVEGEVVDATHDSQADERGEQGAGE